MYSSMKGIHLGMTLFPLYKSALAFPALEKYYPLFFLALAPVTARPFEYSSSVPCGAQEREKSISRSSLFAYSGDYTAFCKVQENFSLFLFTLSKLHGNLYITVLSHRLCWVDRRNRPEGCLQKLCFVCCHKKKRVRGPEEKGINDAGSRTNLRY